MTKFKLDIKEPCSQKWENFTPSGENGFCSQCQKEVIDFTKLSDTEIREYFKNPQAQVCGQFRDDQLRVYSDPRANKNLSRWLAWPIAATAALFSGNVVMGQEREAVEIVNKKESAPKTDLPIRLISGTVIDDAGEGLPGVNVVIKGTTTGTVSDLEGRFELEVPKGYSWLIFSSVGMETTEYKIDSNESISITMPLSYTMLGLVGTMGGVTVTRWHTPRGLWYRTKGMVRKGYYFIRGWR